jgi:hypothetical protein
LTVDSIVGRDWHDGDVPFCIPRSVGVWEFGGLVWDYLRDPARDRGSDRYIDARLMTTDVDSDCIGAKAYDQIVRKSNRAALPREEDARRIGQWRVIDIEAYSTWQQALFAFKGAGLAFEAGNERNEKVCHPRKMGLVRGPAIRCGLAAHRISADRDGRNCAIEHGG